MDNDDLDEPDDNPFLVLWFLMDLIWGRLLWPLVIVNVLTALWLGYQSWHSFMAFLASL